MSQFRFIHYMYLFTVLCVSVCMLGMVYRDGNVIMKVSGAVSDVCLPEEKSLLAEANCNPGHCFPNQAWHLDASCHLRGQPDGNNQNQQGDNYINGKFTQTNLKNGNYITGTCQTLVGKIKYFDTHSISCIV